MRRKQQVRHIVQPKTKSRAEQLKFLAELRGEARQKPRQKTLNVKKFLIISAVVIVLLVGAVFFSDYRMQAIDIYNQQVELTGQGAINTSTPIYTLVRIAALVGLSFAASYAMSAIPWLGGIPSGVKIILLTVALSLGAALLFPVEEDDHAA